jgi:DNA (cytosine-5)-methyltransferase 1
MQLDAPILSLFSGIAGFERGFTKAGFHGEFIEYENWKPARDVLQNRFPCAQLHSDVRDIPADMHGAEIVVAGFPCTDLSQAGRQAGIEGSASGLIMGVLESVARARPEWVLLENVPNMLWLKRGNAMTVITQALTDAGYAWAYRILDAQYFGLTQRRKRVFLLASQHHDPNRILFRDLPHSRAGARVARSVDTANGFYWTEGNRGIGWGAGVIPTIKGSTTRGIPSSPAVWIPGSETDSLFRTPSIEALEIMQGFTAGWTQAAPPRDRWKLVGNAVAVPVVRWIADGLAAYGSLPVFDLKPHFAGGTKWDWAAVSTGPTHVTARISQRPSIGTTKRHNTLRRILEDRGSHPLSRNAARGFTQRLMRSNLSSHPRFRDDLVTYSGL